MRFTLILLCSRDADKEQTGRVLGGARPARVTRWDPAVPLRRYRVDGHRAAAPPRRRGRHPQRTLRLHIQPEKLAGGGPPARPGGGHPAPIAGPRTPPILL